MEDGLKFVAIVGPTASGKSSVGIELSIRLGGEVINYDSLQVYRYLDIGTAKVPPSERKGVPHHLIDIVDPDEEFNAYLFRNLAIKTIKEIISRGKIPILVGGTGLYLRALERGLFHQNEIKPYREMADRMIEEKGLDWAYKFLVSIDSGLSYIGKRDRRRIRRALEIYLMTGKSIRELWGDGERISCLKIGLLPPRDELYRRINERTEMLFKRGWVDEVENILNMGYKEGLKPLQSIGYREIILYLRGMMDLERVIELTKKRTRNYARRQIIWFRKENVLWFTPPYPLEKISSIVKYFMN